MPVLLRTALAGSLMLLGAAPAAAVVIPFSGTLTRSNPPAGPVGRCASLTPPALTIINNNEGSNISRGTSNLGDFANVASECIRFPPGIAFDGEFTFTFDPGGSIFGTRTSVTTPIENGLFRFNGEFVVTGGTGRFAGATGLFSEVGTLDRVSVPGLALANGIFEGTLNVVPEPAALALFGLGALGLAAVRRRSI